MTRRQWSLVILMILINYLVFSQLFNRITRTDLGLSSSTTPAPEATFTTTPTLEVSMARAPTLTPTEAVDLGPPTPTSTRVIFSAGEARAATATAEALAAQQPTADQQANAPAESAPSAPSTDTTPRVTASNSAVNLRTGPGVNYDRAGTLPQGQSLDIVGRNTASTWWQVTTSSGLRWIAASVTTSSNVGSGIPVVQAPAPPPQPAPPPTTAPQPAAPAQPQFQYTINNVFGQVNEAITQVRGEIKDSAGNKVNGVRVRVRSGSFCTVSNPSGPPGGYPNGGYDILLDNRAKPGQWQVAIVNGPSDPQDSQCNDGLAVLSEEVSVPTNTLEGVVFVEWKKNY